MVKGRRAFGLNDRQPRYPRNEAQRVQFSQSLTERGGVSQIAAGKYDPIGRVPIALIEHLDDDGLLAFYAKGIDGVQQVDAQAFGERAHQGEKDRKSTRLNSS